MKNDYIVRNVYRSFMIVCSMAMVSSTVGALVDNIVVGRFMGTEALGAMGVAMPVNFLFMALGTLCASDGALAMSKMAVRFLAIGLPLRFVNFLLSQYYQSIGRTRLAIFISVIEVFAASVFVAAVLKGPMGADGIWLSFLIGECLTLIITMVVIWVIGKHGSLMDRIIMLPDDFGGSDEDKLSVSIGNSMDEVIGLNITKTSKKKPRSL